MEPDLPTPSPRSVPRGQRAADEDAQVLSVADLDRRLKRVVEGATESVRVAGEVSNLKKHASGHSYFTLKDEEEEASIDCVMYRTAPGRARQLLEDGARVVLRGRATVFVPRGRLQLIADDAQLEGRGALLEALERLKEKLGSEGLFDRERKRPLPRDAKVIGVVTSGDGAAIHDIIKVAFQRGSVRLVLARAPVQGRVPRPRKVGRRPRRMAFGETSSARARRCRGATRRRRSRARSRPSGGCARSRRSSWVAAAAPRTTSSPSTRRSSYARPPGAACRS